MTGAVMVLCGAVKYADTNPGYRGLAAGGGGPVDCLKSGLADKLVPLGGR